MLTCKEVDELWCAERMGLIPDPWLQTAEVCATLANIHASKESKGVKPDDFFYKVR